MRERLMVVLPQCWPVAPIKIFLHIISAPRLGGYYLSTVTLSQNFRKSSSPVMKRRNLTPMPLFLTRWKRFWGTFLAHMTRASITILLLSVSLNSIFILELGGQTL